jgi:hydrogenase nickel incorporation protein HypA/HybF
MHELSLAESVVEIVRSSLTGAPGANVRIVRVSIGALSHVDPGTLSTYFEIAARGTEVAGAQLEIDRIPALARCNDCMKSIEIAAFGKPCPLCGSFDLELLSGDELRVREMEVA